MSTCVAVVVDESYQRYLPLFILFAKTSYPDYGIKVFLQGKLAKPIRLSIEKREFGKLEIKEEFLSRRIRDKQAFKTLRWLLAEELFEGYENIYIGDVDLLICREEPSLENVHIAHCRASHLPYSNCIRPGTTRLTGLHFVRIEPYYQKMRQVIQKYQEELDKNAIDFSSLRNEHILYRMILESGMGLPKDEHRIDINGSGPHHGLHLGLWRKSPRIQETAVSQILSDRYLQHYAYFQTQETDPFLSPRGYCHREIRNMKRFFSSLIPLKDPGR